MTDAAGIFTPGFFGGHFFPQRRVDEPAACQYGLIPTVIMMTRPDDLQAPSPRGAETATNRWPQNVKT